MGTKSEEKLRIRNLEKALAAMTKRVQQAEKELIAARGAVSPLGCPEGQLPTIITAVQNSLRFQRDEAVNKLQKVSDERDLFKDTLKFIAESEPTAPVRTIARHVLDEDPNFDPIVELGKLLKEANLPVYFHRSGCSMKGCNCKTSQIKKTP